MTKARILIVEDETLIAMNIQDVLKEMGYDVSGVAATGEESIQKASGANLDLVLMDIRLKGEMDGVEAAKTIRQRFNVPVVFLTSCTDDNLLQKIKMSGSYGYILKPFQDRELQTIIEIALYKNKMEESLRESEERYRSLMKTATDAIVSANSDGIIISWNEGARKIFGYNEEEVIDKPLTMLIPEKFKDAHENGIKRASTTGKYKLMGKTIELCGLRKDNSEFPLEVSFGIWKSGNEVYYSGIIRDITGRKRMEDELARERSNLEETVNVRTGELRESLQKAKDANLLLEKANQSKSKFLSSMSHELRTPLNAILGFTDLLYLQFFGKLNEKQLDYIKQIDTSGKHLLALINELLDVAKIDAGAMELTLSKVSLDDVINMSVSIMGSQFKKKNLHVNISVDKEIPFIVADIQKCKQIMFNLLSNAQKYTPDGGRIEIRCAKESNSQIKIEVSDTGIGIEEGEVGKIFSEFYQSDHVRDEQLGGTGIGLALTRRLVELHGGEIGIESKVGKGSTFWFTLPLKR